MKQHHENPDPLTPTAVSPMTQTPAAWRETPDIETASDDYARRFSGPAGAYFLAMQNRALMASMADIQTASILDLGGGHAQLLPALLEKGYKVTVAGSDNQCHHRVRSAFPSVPCITGDLLHLPLADRSFDYVVSVRLISHIEQWPALIQEMCRVAKYGVVIDYPSLMNLNILTPLLFSLKKKIEGNTRTYISFFERELLRQFAACGFRKKNSKSQFFLPMFIHRKLQGAKFLQTIEQAAAWTGLTKVLGSPVILRVDRTGVHGRR